MKIRHVATNYLITDRVLYNKGYSKPYLRWFTHSNLERIPRELHELYVACHESDKSIISKVLRYVYY